ncbi:MAG TPA: general secretion pathway protein GspB [Burkholderiaceae bacterium]|nr:general secretion pathway protein GspB [Burkholderiaceae bacterium]
MSYILDALRRADAERSRGVVPGLHAQGLPAGVEPPARDRRPLIRAAGAIGVLLVAGVAILLAAPWKSAPAPAAESRAAPARPPAPPDAAAPAQMAQGEPPQQQPGAIEPGARPVEPTMARGNPPPMAPADARPPQAYPPPPQTARPAPRDTPADRAALAGRGATPETRAAVHPAPQAPAAPVEHYGAPIAATAPPAAARGDAVPNIKDLPPDVRAQLPKLAVAGSVYSETPAARMIILNGQVFHEGEKPAPDTVLEQIRLKSAILNFRGQRYEISF